MYTIFSIDFQNDPFRMDTFMRFLSGLPADGKFVPLIGSYQGQKEHSFICRKTDFNAFIRYSSFIKGQDTVLHVATGNKQETVMEFLRGGLFMDMLYPIGSVVGMGCMHEVDLEEALENGDYTYNPKSGKYWVCRKGNPDKQSLHDREEDRKAAYTRHLEGICGFMNMAAE